MWGVRLACLLQITRTRLRIKLECAVTRGSLKFRNLLGCMVVDVGNDAMPHKGNSIGESAIAHLELMTFRYNTYSEM
jgi:hypothetical protein